MWFLSLPGQCQDPEADGDVEVECTQGDGENCEPAQTPCGLTPKCSLHDPPNIDILTVSPAVACVGQAVTVSVTNREGTYRDGRWLKQVPSSATEPCHYLDTYLPGKPLTLTWSGPGTGVAPPPAPPRFSFTIPATTYPAPPKLPAGTYAVSATLVVQPPNDPLCTGNPTAGSPAKTLTVVEVASISADKVLACKGCTVTLTAIPNPAGQPLNCLEWQKRDRATEADGWGDWTGFTGGTPSATWTAGDAGFYEFRVRNGAGDAWHPGPSETDKGLPLTVVEIENIAITAGGSGDSNTNNGGNPAPVCAGSTVSFEAYFKPEDEAPEGVEWTVKKLGAGGGAPVSIGSGKTASYTFSEPGKYWVKANCCGTDKTMFLEAIKVTFTGLAAVCEGGTASVGVTVAPSSPTTSISLKLETTTGTGSATFANGLTSTTITGSGPVTVKGVTASSVAGNIKLSADNIGDGDCFTAEFTVVLVEFAPIVAVCKDGTQDVAVTVTPSPPGVGITLKLQTTTGTGSATFADGSTAMPFTGSPTVTIKGVTVSSDVDNIRLYAEVAGSDCFAGEKFSVLKVDLDEAAFQGTGIHGLLNDDGTYGNDGTGSVRVPQIKVGSVPMATEICYTWESSPEIAAKFTISPSLTTPVPARVRIEGVQNGRAGTLVYEKDISLNGVSLTETFATADKLTKLVDNTTYDLTWKLSLDGGVAFSTLATTANKLFVTAGAPGGGFTTLTRLSRVTDECKGLVSEPDIVKRLWEKVAGPGAYVLGSPYPSPEWKILDGTPGECIAIAKLFEKTIQMVGLKPGSGSVVYLYAATSGGSHESAATDNYATRDCRIGQNGHTATVGETHHLQNDFEKLTFQDGGGGWNNWEACYKYRHTAGDPWTWYAAGTGGASYSSVQGCMDDICVQTRWRYCTAEWVSLGTCVAPGPYPEHVW